jgi:hypothetical protein
MKMNPIVLSVLLIAAGSVAAYAKPGADKDGHKNRQGPPSDGEPRPSREEVMNRFDADGDGTLNEAEREAMREAMPKHGHHGKPGRPSREEILERYDADGDGELNEEERAALREDREARREERRQQMLERFDADGDGELSEEERETLRETLRAEKPRPPEEEDATQTSETGE